MTTDVMTVTEAEDALKSAVRGKRPAAEVKDLQRRLREVDLRYSRATASGVRELVAGLPKCNVMFQASSNGEVTRTTSAESVEAKGEAGLAELVARLGSGRRGA